MSGPTSGRGRWLPADREALQAWLHDFKANATAEQAPRHPVIQELADLIVGDPILRMYFANMIGQAPATSRYRARHLESVEQLLDLVNAALTYVPSFKESAYVGCPLTALLEWSMATPAGFAAFRHPAVNAILKKILSVWCEYLTSPASLHVINDTPDGWKSEAARARIGIMDFQHDPDHPHWGFKSWNDFFTVASSLEPARSPGRTTTR